MLNTLALLHTSHVLIPTFTQLAGDLLPGVEIFHVVDESLIRNTIREQRLTAATKRRVLGHIELAREGGADAVLVTCSSIGPSVPLARKLVDFPVFRIDEAMAAAAVRQASRIGVAATLRTTLEPTIELLHEAAAAAGRTIQVVPQLCEQAFDAVLAGNTARHDKIVKEALEHLLGEVELVVLAQASMARAIAAGHPNGARVLTSPELALRQIRQAVLSEPATVRG